MSGDKQAMVTTTGAVTMALVYVLAAVGGAADAVDIPARQAFVVEMVGPDDVQNAVGLNSSLFNLARVLGPAIGGVMIATVGVAACFWVNAMSFVPVLLALALMRTAELHPVTLPPSGRLLTQLGEGIRYAARTPDIALVLGLVAVIGTLGYNFTVMLPLLARYAFDMGPDGLGALVAAMGVGSLAAAVHAASRGRPTRRVVVLSAVAFSVALLLLGSAPGRTLAAAVLVLAGFCGILFHTTANSRLQLLVPGELRGRVMSIYAFLFLGTTPLGSLIVGVLAGRVGIRITIVGLALSCVIGVGVGVAFAMRLHRIVPSPLAESA